MKILSKTIEIEVQTPTDNKIIERKLKDLGMDPLRWSIVNVDCNKLTINVSYENL